MAHLCVAEHGLGNTGIIQFTLLAFFIVCQHAKEKVKNVFEKNVLTNSIAQKQGYK